MYSTVQAYTCYLIVVTGKTYCKEEDVYQGIPMFESLGSDQLFKIRIELLIMLPKDMFISDC